MAEKIVIIGASDFQNPLILKAKEKGYETHVFAWQDGSVGEHTADYFYPVSITEKEKILEICRSIGPSGVVSIGSDLAVVTVNYVAERLGLVCNGPENTRLATNKYEMLKAFARNGDPSPAYRLVSWRDGHVAFTEGGEWADFLVKDSEKDFINTHGQIAGLAFPVIVKPVDRSGSRGITLLSGPEGLEQAVEAACAQSFLHQAVIEEFVEGEEFSVEFISYEKQHYFLALTRKFTTGAPHFIETGHIQPAAVPDLVAEQVKQVVSHALDTLCVAYGASHGEVKVSPEGKVTIIEIGARMGGDCIGSDLVPLSTGYDFVGMTVDIACGKPLKLVQEAHHREARIRFVFSPEDLEEQEAIRKAGVEQVWRISPMEPFDGHGVTDSSNRYGYMITTRD